jgi:phospholipase C
MWVTVVRGKRRRREPACCRGRGSWGYVVRQFIAVGAAAAIIAGVMTATSAATPGTAGAQAAANPRAVTVSPIEHVVVIFQENHSFDNVLGGICVHDHLKCDGATRGRLSNGRVIKLSRATNVVRYVEHTAAAQTRAINGGRMNGFDQNLDCGAKHGYACYSQFTPKGIPTLRKLAEAYTISDHTFSQDPVPSWGGHLDLVAGTTDGFVGDNPGHTGVNTKKGWGCDSGLTALWRDPSKPFSPLRYEPSCIPRPDGSGAFRATPVQYVPTILDRLTQAGQSWKLYADQHQGQGGYQWSVCPSFAECLYDRTNGGKPNPNWVARSQFYRDAKAGTLPAYSAIMPDFRVSQHNGSSMLTGDNYIQLLVKAVMHGPKQQWDSTVFFITYDDCGCFYDHVRPPAGLGIRVPMVLVGPRVKAHFVDHHIADFDSMLSFVQHNFHLAPLTRSITTAYDYCHSFVFTTLPCTGGAAPNHSAPGGPTQIPLQPAYDPNPNVGHPDPNDPT